MDENQQGGRQGCVASPHLFTMYTEMISLENKGGFRIGSRVSTILDMHTIQEYLQTHNTLSQRIRKNLEASQYWFLRRMLIIPWTNKVSTCEVFPWS